MNSQQRKCGSFTLNQVLDVEAFVPNSEVALCGITINADVFGKKAGVKYQYEAKDISEAFLSHFEHQVFCAGQSLALDFEGSKLDLTIESFEHISLDDPPTAKPSSRGQVLKGQTQVTWKKAPGSQTHIVFVGGAGPARNDSLFKSDFNFEQMGIGGLDEQFKKMFRTAFASRIFPGLVKQLGINHIRGMLLYGEYLCQYYIYFVFYSDLGEDMFMCFPDHIFRVFNYNFVFLTPHIAIICTNRPSWLW